MDLFQHRYYRLGKNLMSFIGLWPYQSPRTKWVCLAVYILFNFYQAASHVLVLVKYYNDWNVLLECLVPLVFDAICLTKYINFLWYSQNTLKLMNRIRTDWHVWARDRDVNILHEYAQRGSNICILYTGLIGYTMQPATKKLISIVLYNDTEPGKFALPVIYYHLDMQKYYFYLTMYCTASACMTLTFSISCDVMLVIYVQHVCGIFAAVGHKLERMRSNDTSGKISKSPCWRGKTDIIYVASCIDRHNDAIE